VRLLLCGSALSFMRKLLVGSAPLRGRAGLELLVRTLDFRLAREFGGIGDLRTAVLTNAVVGGTPAYRREFAQDDAPANLGDFDPWVCRTVLNPGRPLFREARYILAEEPDIHDTALYHAVLAAIAEGNTTRGGIADYLERPGRAPRAWRRSQHAFHSSVVGPHFEEICRQWTRWHAGPQTYGGAYPVLGRSGGDRDVLLAIGEAKWQEIISASHLERLEHIRELLAAKGEPGAQGTRLFLFSGAGFSDALAQRAAKDPSVQLIGLDRLYYGSRLPSICGLSTWSATRATRNDLQPKNAPAAPYARNCYLASGRIQGN
jgi:uncharacterized protein